MMMNFPIATTKLPQAFQDDEAAGGFCCHRKTHSWLLPLKATWLRLPMLETKPLEASTVEDKVAQTYAIQNKVTQGFYCLR